MDPQQKLVLQCVYRALEDAGIPMEEASGSRTGVYLGEVTCFQLYDILAKQTVLIWGHLLLAHIAE